MQTKERTDAPRTAAYKAVLEQLRTTLTLAELNRLRMFDLRQVIAEVAEREQTKTFHGASHE